jgi:hypothetical protein
LRLHDESIFTVRTNRSPEDSLAANTGQLVACSLIPRPIVSNNGPLVHPLRRVEMKKPKPLATVDQLEIHRATFRPFGSVKYLDLAALQKARGAEIEIGSVEGGGAETTLVATVNRGKITKLTLIGCKGCSEAKGARKRGTPPKKALRAALTRMRELGLQPVKLPIPINNLKALLAIEIGPIIIYGDPFDICIAIDDPDGGWCVFCLSGIGLCVGPVVLN